VNRDSGTDSANGGWLRRLVRHTVSHNTGSKTTASQRKQANKPNTATSRYVLHDNKLTRNTAAISTPQIRKLSVPENPVPNELYGRQNLMLKYAAGTSVKSAALKTLDEVESVIAASVPNEKS
jgi:hypothetical protein